MQRHDTHFYRGSQSLDEFTGSADVFLRIIAARNQRYPDIERNMPLGDSPGITEDQLVRNAGESLVLLGVHMFNVPEKEVHIG